MKSEDKIQDKIQIEQDKFQTGNQIGWAADLAEFFGGIEREDRVFANNVERKTRFYAEIARPALDAVKDQLKRFGRECETGLDHERVFIIVRKAAGVIEFQYAVVAEVRIETVTPFAHCWFETELPDEIQQETLQENQAAQKSAANDENGADGGEKSDDSDGGESKEESGGEKSDKPKRTKTIELLGGWSIGRDIETVSGNEITADFVRHYQEAVSRLRADLHAAEF